MKIGAVTSLVQDGLNKATSATKFVSAFKIKKTISVTRGYSGMMGGLSPLSDSPAAEIQMGEIRVGQNMDTFI